ncbi:MAG: hybrid sensor histidine kinase/response regulator [Pseudomonadota bacterium]
MTSETKDSQNIPGILIVDDVPANLKLLSEMLRMRGYEPRPIPSGKLALQAAQADPPDLILLDIRMPEMNGFEVCERLKADAALKEIPVIFITAMTDTADKVKSFSLGAVDYVTKPFQVEEVCARVDVHLELRRRKRELQRSYDKLRELETMRDSLVHMIVHDMRSPLMAVLGNLELAETEPLPQDATESIAAASASARTILEMISSLLDVSKMEAGLLTPELSAVDMNALASEAIQMIEPLRSQRALTLASTMGMDTFAGDANLIRRVLQNLIGNAIKFTDKKNGIITVGIAVTAEDKMRVSVADNGPGIPVEYRDKVFDKFCQVGTRKQSRAYSTGLGLTFCKLAVEAHRGRIGLESDEGKGSTFWFELPRN